jgi:hypothetical protein
MNKKKQSVTEIILLGVAYAIVMYGALFFRYALIVGTCLAMVGCFLWAKRKNRSRALMLLGILSLVGYIILALLKDKTEPQVTKTQS